MRRQPTTQQITWFLDLDRNKQLDLNPPYQRKSVWSPKDRRYFIDTIFRNYPTPPIFIHRTVDENGIPMYHVVDGKQRLETILMFAKNKVAIAGDYGDQNLDDKRFNDLGPLEKRRFWDYVLVVDFIESIDGNNIEEVFDRVNRNSRNLQPQELRHAKYNGWFINEAENESEEEFWWDIRVSTKAKDKRMRNVQFISELLLVALEKSIVGFSQEYLDNKYSEYDQPEETVPDFDEDSYKSVKASIKIYLSEMEKANRCISNHGKTANNMYTLWSLVTINHDRLPAPSELAQRYDAFMKSVKSFVEAEDPEAVYENGDAQQLKNSFNYYRSSRGAATELPQRIERLEALSKAILN